MTKAENIHAEIAAMIEVKYATKNPAYASGRTITPTGCVNHSVGVAQPSADVFVNTMNQSGATWGVHAILGDFHKGPGRIILVMPFNRRPWGCGAGGKGSYNNSRVQWEVCEPRGHTYAGGTMIGYDVKANEDYFARMWALLVKFNVYVALECGYDASAISDHAEAHAAGMGSNHSDMGHWLPKHGKSMNDLRAEVKAILDAHNKKEEDFDVTKDELKAIVREVLEEDNPTYKDLSDVPEYWKPQAKAMLDAGAINGGTPAEENPTDVNIRRETLKAAVISTLYHDSQEQPETKLI